MSARAPIAIVDPYSSGTMLAEALRHEGVRCVAVRSSPRLPESVTAKFRPELFDAVIEHGDDVEATLAAVRQHRPSHVVPGFESGVPLADRLSEALSLPTNGTRLSAARRDKHAMVEAVGAAGLRVPWQHRGGDPEEIVERIDARGAWPVVVKPRASVASDRVFHCAAPDDVRRAVESILAAPNALGDPNDDVLVQEFLDGPEYVVDTVTCGGRTAVTAFWQYTHHAPTRGTLGYDAMALLPYDGARQPALRAFTERVLEAVGIVFGPAHCELIWLDDGPVFVEIGARLTAGINAVLSRICGGTCQLDATVDVLLRPERFPAATEEEFQLRKRGANVFLFPPAPGRLIRVDHLDVIRSLPAFHSMSVADRPGEVVPRVAGLVTLVAEDDDALARDVATIRRLEQDGLFHVAPLGDGGPPTGWDRR